MNIVSHCLISHFTIFNFQLLFYISLSLCHFLSLHTMHVITHTMLMQESFNSHSKYVLEIYVYTYIWLYEKVYTYVYVYAYVCILN